MNMGYIFTNMPIEIENQVHNQEAYNIFLNSRPERVATANLVIIWRLQKLVTVCVPPKNHPTCVLKQTETAYFPNNLRAKHQCPDSLFDKEETGWSFLSFAYLAISTNESQALGNSSNHCPDNSLILKLLQPKITTQINWSIDQVDRGYSKLGFEQSWAWGTEEGTAWMF